VTATTPGTLRAHIALVSDQRYELWLGGSFARGFRVHMDGRMVGRVEDQLQNIGQYSAVATRYRTRGVHTITLEYPPAGVLTPGSGAELTQLSAISLEPLDSPRTEMISVTPARAGTLCGRELDWIEIVR